MERESPKAIRSYVFDFFGKLKSKIRSKSPSPQTSMPEDTSTEIQLSARFQEYILKNFTSKNMSARVLEADEEAGYLSLDIKDPGIYLEDIFLGEDDEVIAKRTQLFRGEEEGESLYLYFNGDIREQVNIHYSIKNLYGPFSTAVHFDWQSGHASVLYHNANNLDICVPEDGKQTVVFRRSQEGNWIYRGSIYNFQKVESGEETLLGGSCYELTERKKEAEVRVAGERFNREIICTAALQDVFRTKVPEIFAKARQHGRDWVQLRDEIPVRLQTVEPPPDSNGESRDL